MGKIDLAKVGRNVAMNLKKHSPENLYSLQRSMRQRASEHCIHERRTTMGKIDLAKVGRNVAMNLKKHSPEIMTGIGIAGMATSTVLAVRATPKALMLIEEEKRRLNADIRQAAKANGDEVIPVVDKLTPIDTVKTTWKCYIPAAAMGTVSMACLIGACSVSVRRNAALAAAYTLSESMLKDYRGKVIETVGEEKEKEVRKAVAKEQIERNPVENNEVIITSTGDDLCYDVLSGRYFKSDISKIKQAVNEINRQLLFDTYVSLNSFYYAIGLDGTKIGDDLGWTVEKGLIELDFDAKLDAGGTPCVVLDYTNMPFYDYDKFL